MKKVSRLLAHMALVMTALIYVLTPFKVKAAGTGNTIFSGNRYISMSPNGTAFTVGYGDKAIEKHDYSYMGYVHQQLGNIGPTPLEDGQHYYKGAFVGAVPVAYWKVSHTSSACIHSNSSMDITFCGLNEMGANISNCYRYYSEGWFPYCAICGELIVKVNFYMTEDMANTISYLPSGLPYSAYFYLCPYDNSLENTSRINHVCTKVSNNRYKLIYHSGSEECGGVMAPEWFYYNNASQYEGEAVTAQTKLSTCGFYREGYIFDGWAFYPDGDVVFSDMAEWTEVQNAFDLGSKGNETEIALYAVWRPVSSKLHISYGGGSVSGGSADVLIEGRYGSSIELERPVFSDIKITLDASPGLIENRTDIVLNATRTFTEWRRSTSFHGRLTGDTYYFLSTIAGSTDYLTACSSIETIILPAPRRSGYCFEGWFAEDGSLAGYGGDEYTPATDEKLIAHWREVSLALTTEPDYDDTSNGGKGAADLYWESNDDRADATYRVLQSLDEVSWNVVGDNGTIYSSNVNTKSFDYNGGTESRFVVESTGVYQIELLGAAGGKTGNYEGGKGGKVTLRMWLEKGEVLSLVAGGKGADYSSLGLSGTYLGGAGGGGKGYGQAGGGGATWLYITDTKANRQLVAVAGGGGGGSFAGKGGAGGSSANVLQYGQSSSGRTSTSSQSGTTVYTYYSSGGGGGYNPGKGGQIVYRRHVHSSSAAECGYHTHTGNSSSGGGCYSVASTTGSSIDYPIVCYSNSDESYVCHMHNLGYPVYGTIINCSTYGYLDGYWHYTGRTGYLSCPLCGTNPNMYSDGQIGGTYSVNTTVTTYSLGCGKNAGYNCVSRIPLTNTYYSQQSYVSGGGANSVFVRSNTEYRILSCSYNSTNCFGVNSGNGNAKVTTLVSNCMVTNKLLDVPATDLSAPERITEYTVIPIGGDLVKINWNEPKDNGTKYYFKVEDYSSLSGERVAVSNISAQTLTTGVKGYYLLENNSEGTVVNASNGLYMTESEVTILLSSGEEKYLHIAPVDKAGNVGASISIRLSAGTAADADTDIPMLWNIHTNKLKINEGDNVYEKESDVYFIKADGNTPIYLELGAQMDGDARETYRINECIFEEEATGSKLNVLIRDFSNPAINGESVGYEMNSEFPLCRYSFTQGSVHANGGEILLKQGFVAPTDADGKTISVIPRAAATESRVEEGRRISDRGLDQANGITLILDGTAPDIEGLEAINPGEFLIDYGDELSVVTIHIRATDEISGVNTEDYYVVFENNDNGCIYKWNADESGEINIVIDDSVMEEIFRYGSFTVTVHAADNVGNVAEEVVEGYDFDLDTGVKRLLEPVDGKTVFARGESGELTIITRGYADYVEVIFPDELSAYNVVFDYTTNPEYEKEETIQFMIPLYELPEGDLDFTITVVAHRDEHELESHPRINVVEVSGSVLEELFTSLR